MNKLSGSWLQASSNSVVTRSNVLLKETLVNVKVSKPEAERKLSRNTLLLGFTENARPLHIQVSLAETELVKIITIYDPDPNEWIDYRQRR